MISLTLEIALLTPTISIPNPEGALPFPSQAVPLSRSSSASWTPVDAPEGTAARCNPVSRRVSTSDEGIRTSDKVNFHGGIATRVVDLAGSDFLDCHDGSESVCVGIGWNAGDEDWQS